MSSTKISYFAATLLFVAIMAASVVWPATIQAVPSDPATNQEYYRGVNLFGGWQGLYGDKSVFATPEMLDYFKSKGLNTFRVGIAWQTLQPTLNGPFDPTYLALMDTLVANARARGQRLTFVPLPGKYKNNDVATAAVPQAAFNDFLIRMAQHYKNEPAIWGYNLINEPGMGDTWNTAIAPSAIAAIRTVDMKKPIIVPTATGGYGHFFRYHLAGLPMQDPANNLIYEAHFYFDTPPNGQYPKGWDVPNNNLNIGVENAKDFVEWCVNNNVRCFAGEYGIPAGWKYGTQTCIYLGGTNKDPRWLAVLDNFLTYLDQNKISGAYWAGGPYGDISSVGPFCDTQGNFIDGPQMAILTKHLGSNVSTPVASPTPPPSPSPTPTPSPSPTPKVTPTPTPKPQCASDINLDGITDIKDYNLLVVNFFKQPIATPRTDINADNKVDLSDFSLLVVNFFKTCS